MATNGPGDAGYQVPPAVVRGIVITVLQSQGVTEPSEEVLQRAIMEYYSKHPQTATTEVSMNYYYVELFFKTRRERSTNSMRLQFCND